MKTIHVNIKPTPYTIYIGQNLLTNAELLRQQVVGSQAVIVTNSTVAPLYLANIKSALADVTVDVITLADGEQHKTPDSLLQIINSLAEHQHHRDTTLLALGGGVVGDMTGFAAATYQRGVAFVQLPTSLLAQVDASVGGKTAVNLPQGKNLWGAFHQPCAVIIDTTTLTTLPDRQLRAGLAEVVKAGLLADADFFEWLVANMSSILALDHAVVTQAIYQACKIKVQIVEGDVTEQQQRALLNLGHTFGHAIEQNLGYRDCLHGEAVAIGIVLAAKLSATLGYIADADVAHIVHLLKLINLPTELPASIQLTPFINAMYADKKILQQTLRLILLKKIGQAIIVSDISKQQLLEFLKSQGLSD